MKYKHNDASRQSVTKKNQKKSRDSRELIGQAENCEFVIVNTSLIRHGIQINQKEMPSRHSALSSG